MDPGDFCKETQRIITGQGFWRDKTVSAGFREPSGIALVNYVAAGGICSLANTETPFLWWDVPGDFDESLDALKLRLLASNAAAAAGDTLVISAGVRYRVGGLAAGTAITALGGSAQAVTAALKLLEFDLSGNGLKANDKLRLLLTSANSSSSEHIITGAVMRYRSDLAMYDPAAR